MGGDDLGGDDEYFLETQLSHQDDESISDDDEDQRFAGDLTASSRTVDEAGTTKRKLPDADDHVAKKGKKMKTTNSSAEVLLEAARHLERQLPEQQAAFLDAALKHHRLLVSSSSSQAEKDMSNTLIEPHHLVRISAQEGDLTDGIKDAVSLKRLKNWKYQGSPCVVRVGCSDDVLRGTALTLVAFVKLMTFDLYVHQLPDRCLHIRPPCRCRAEGVVPAFEIANGEALPQERVSRGATAATFLQRIRSCRGDTASAQRTFEGQQYWGWGWQLSSGTELGPHAADRPGQPRLQ